MGAGTLILIDTHVLLWAMGLPGKLGESTRRMLQAAPDEARLAISAITGWEIAMLVDKGRIGLGMPNIEWLANAAAALDLETVPIDLDIAVDAGSLPGDIHGDPCDRLLIATARKLGCRFISVDRAILAYSTQGHVHVLDGRH